jgi:RNA polymerase sigma-70 factor (ECF subfamily)
VEATVGEPVADEDAAGEQAHFELADVFDAHAAYVGRALRCLGVGERELPDAVQEVFVVVARKLGGFERRASIRTWLYAICLRQAMRVRRTAARRREDTVAEPPVEPVAAGAQEDAIEHRRKLEVALSILDGLDDMKRTVFVLYEVEQLPMSEVAEVVGCPIQTAYSRLYAARREVAARLARKEKP